MGLLDAFQLEEALRLPFLHVDLFLGELRARRSALASLMSAWRCAMAKPLRSSRMNVSRYLLAAKSCQSLPRST